MKKKIRKSLKFLSSFWKKREIFLEFLKKKYFCSYERNLICWFSKKILKIVNTTLVHQINENHKKVEKFNCFFNKNFRMIKHLRASVGVFYKLENCSLELTFFQSELVAFYKSRIFVFLNFRPTQIFLFKNTNTR